MHQVGAGPLPKPHARCLTLTRHQCQTRHVTPMGACLRAVSLICVTLRRFNLAGCMCVFLSFQTFNLLSLWYAPPALLSLEATSGCIDISAEEMLRELNT